MSTQGALIRGSIYFTCYYGELNNLWFFFDEAINICLKKNITYRKFIFHDDLNLQTVACYGPIGHLPCDYVHRLNSLVVLSFPVLALGGLSL